MSSGNIAVDTIAIVNPVNSQAISLQTNGAASTISLTVTGGVSQVPQAHSVSLLAGTGTIAGMQPALTIAPDLDASNNGGSVFLSASNLGATALTLNVNGAGGNGGTASYVSTNTAAFAPTSSNLLIKANGVNAGTAVISTGGNLTYTVAVANDIIQAAPTALGNGQGANITLTAGAITTGNLLVVGALSANGATTNGAGGSLTLNSNSSTAFTIDSGTATNGTTQALSVSGIGSGAMGSITVHNTGGGVTSNTEIFSSNVKNLTLSAAGSASGAITVGQNITTTGNITLTAGGTGAVLTGSKLLTAPSVSLGSGTGSIGTGAAGATTAIQVDTSTLTANTSGTGSVNVKNTGTGELTIGQSTAGTTFAVVNSGASSGATPGISIATSGSVTAGTSVTLTSTATNGSIQLDGNLSATNTTSGAVTLTATGTGAITDPSGVVQAKTLTLNTGGSGTIGSALTPLDISTSTLSANSAGSLVNLSNLGFPGTGIAPLTVSTATTTGSFTLTSSTGVTVTPTMTAAKTISIDALSGNITLNGATLGSSTNTTAVNLTAVAGNITGAATITTTGAGAVQLNTFTGTLGTAAAPLKLNTLNVSSTTTPELINLSDSNTGSVAVTSPLTSTGAVTFASAGATSFEAVIGSAVKLTTSGGGITLGGNVTGSTSVTVSNTSTTLGGAIIIDGNITATSATGTVALTASGTGTISDPNGKTVQATTVSFNTAGGHNVGSLAFPVDIAAENLSANATGILSVNNVGPNALTLTSANAATVNLLSVSTVNVATPLTSAASITINTSSGNGSINLNGATLGSAASTNLIALTTANGDISGPAVLTTKTGVNPVVQLSTTSGSFGTPTTALKINTQTFTPSAGAGSVNVDDVSTLPTLVNTMVSTGGSVKFVSAGNTTFNDVKGTNVTLIPGGTSTTFTGLTAITTVGGAGTVTIAPALNTLPINIAGGTGGFQISPAQLNAISAANVILGSSTATGGINLNATLSLSKGYNLQLLQGAGSFNANGNAVNITNGGSFGVSLVSGNIKMATFNTNATDLGGLSLQTNGAASTITLASVPNVHSISILAGTGKISGLSSGTITPRVDAATGNAGSIFLSASNLNTLALVLNASSATGNGGTASYINTSTTTFTPTTSLLTEQIGGVNAGTAIIGAGGNLTYNPSGPSAGVITGITPTGTNGNGAGIELTAGVSGPGLLSVSGALSAAGKGSGNGGSITLNSNSTTAFVVDGTGSNGINGTVTVPGGATSGSVAGSITVTNRGGAITYSQLASAGEPNNLTLSTVGAAAGAISTSQPLSAVNSLTLTAGGTGAILPASNLLKAPNMVLSSGSGSIGTTGTGTNQGPILTDTNNLSANTTGSVNISNTNAAGTALTLNASSAGTTFGVSSSGGDIDTVGAITGGTSVTIKSTASANSGSINVGANITATNATTGLVTLAAATNGSITDTISGGTDAIQGKTVSLTGGTTAGNTIGAAGNAVRVKTSTLDTVAAGLINVDNLGLSGAALTLGTASTAGSFTLQSATAVATSQTLTGASSIFINTSGGTGGITLSGATLGGSTATNSVILSSGTGNISGTAVVTSNGTGTVSLDSSSGSFGTAAAALKVNTPGLATNTTSGLINVNDTDSAATAVSGLSTSNTLTFSSAGSSTFTGTVAGSSVTINSAGANTFNGNVVATTGALSVTETGAGASAFNGITLGHTSVTIKTGGAATINNAAAQGGALTITTDGASSFGTLDAIGAIVLTQNNGSAAMSIGSAAAGTTFSASTAGTGISTTGTVSAVTSVTLKNTGNNGSISLDGNLFASNTTSGVVSLTATGSGTITDAVATGSDFVEGRTLTITTGANNSSSVGSSTTALRVETGTLSIASSGTANSTGLVNVDNLGLNTGTGTLLPLALTAAGTTGSFALQSATGVTVTPTLATATSISINTSAGTGGITLNGATLGSTASTNSVSLTTAGGSITGAATIETNSSVGNSVSLTATSGSLGGTTALKVNTNNVNATTASGVENITDASTGAVSVAALTSSGATTFTTTAASGTTFNGAVSGSTVTLKTNGNTTFNGNVVASSGALTLTETGTGTSTTFNLASVGDERLEGATGVSLSTVGNTTFAANANVSANPSPANPATNANINITDAAGLLMVGASDVFTANGKTSGSITLLENKNVALDGITVGAGAQFNTLVTSKSTTQTAFPLPGQISLVIGTSVPAPQPGVQPANTKVTNGTTSKNTVYWGSIAPSVARTPANPTNLVITGNSAIEFSAGSLAPITLQGGVAGGGASFHADPPIASPAIAGSALHINAQVVDTGVSSSSNGGSNVVIQSAVSATVNLQSTAVGSPANSNALNVRVTSPTSVGFNTYNSSMTAPSNAAMQIGDNLLRLGHGFESMSADTDSAQDGNAQSELSLGSADSAIYNAYVAAHSANGETSASAPTSKAQTLPVFFDNGKAASDSVSSTHQVARVASNSATQAGMSSPFKAPSAFAKALQGGVSEFATMTGAQSGQVEAAISSDRALGIKAGDAPVVESARSTDKHRFVSLHNGAVVFAPFVNTTVDTPFGSVEIDARSLVMVIVSPHGTAVYNIDDQHRDAVRIQVGNHTIPLSPSKQATVTSSTVKAFEQVNPVEAIGYRYMTDSELGDGMKVFNSEFSISSSIGAVKTLRSFITSKHPDAMRVSGHMLKTAAAMMQLKPGSASFQQVTRPRMAAYAEQ